MKNPQEGIQRPITTRSRLIVVNSTAVAYSLIRSLSEIDNPLHRCVIDWLYGMDQYSRHKIRSSPESEHFNHFWNSRILSRPILFLTCTLFKIYKYFRNRQITPLMSYVWFRDNSSHNYQAVSTWRSSRKCYSSLFDIWHCGTLRNLLRFLKENSLVQRLKRIGA